MARNPYPGKTKGWLEEKLANVDEALTSTVDTVSGGDSSATSARRADLRIIKQELLEALSIIDPKNYSGNRRVSKTKADFSGDGTYPFGI